MNKITVYSKEEKRAIRIILFTFFAGCVFNGLFAHDVAILMIKANNNPYISPFFSKAEYIFSSVFNNLIFFSPHLYVLSRYINKIDLYAKKRKIIIETRKIRLLDKYYLKILLLTTFMAGGLFVFYDFYSKLGVFLFVISLIGLFISGNIVLEEENDTTVKQDNINTPLSSLNKKDEHHEFYESLESVNINDVAKNQLRSLGMKTSCEENAFFVINPSDENCKALIEHQLFLRAVQDVLGDRTIDGKHIQRNYIVVDEVAFGGDFIRRTLLAREALDKNDTERAKLEINYLMRDVNKLLKSSIFKTTDIYCKQLQDIYTEEKKNF